MPDSDVEIISDTSRNEKEENYEQKLDETVETHKSKEEINMKEDSISSEEYNKYMSICKVLFRSLIDNKSQQKRQDHEKVHHDHIQKNSIDNSRENEAKNIWGNIDVDALVNVTKTFMPMKTDENFSFTKFPTQQKFNQTRHNLFPLDGSMPSATFNKNLNYDEFTTNQNIKFSEFTSPQNNYFFGNEMAQNHENTMQNTLPTKIIRPYIDDDDDEEPKMYESNTKQKLFDTDCDVTKPPKKFDQGSIADVETEIDQHRMHVAKMVKNLGGLLTSMSYFMK
jgi:hypothetical protein